MFLAEGRVAHAAIVVGLCIPLPAGVLEVCCNPRQEDAWLHKGNGSSNSIPAAGTLRALEKPREPGHSAF